MARIFLPACCIMNGAYEIVARDTDRSWIMGIFRSIHVAGLVLVLVLSSARCASTSPKKADAPKEEPVEAAPQLMDLSADELRQEIRAYVEAQLHERDGQNRAAGTGKSGNQNRREPLSREALAQRARELIKVFREKVHEDLMARIEQDFGVPAAPQVESVGLEAVDDSGNTLTVDVPVETRELRKLTLPANRAKMHALVGEEDLTLALYTDVPSPIAPSETDVFARHYTGDGAAAIAMEARLIVGLKGGAWVTADGGKRVANAVAIRGLDMTEGLLPENTNQRYDDTMFVVLEEPDGEYEVFEYRMTTESSSDEKGVGRLDSKQVTYVRGLHRGKDPGYRLKGGSADGTRVDMDGTYKIAGANIHSAYAKRAITSETPLKDNVSLGCQVVAAGKTPFEKSLVFTLDEKGVKEFPYTIVDQEEIAFLDQSLQEKGQRSVLVHAIARDL